MFNAGIKTPRQNTNQTGNSNQQNTYDRLVTVTGYDIPKQYMYAEDEKGKKFEVFVNREQYDRAEKSISQKNKDSANWMGHSIDAKMEKSIPVGKKVILLRSKVTKVDKTRDISITEVNRIGGVPVPEANKTYQGLFTATYRREDGLERISRVQDWDEKAIDINNEEAIEELKSRIDKSTENYGKKIGDYTVTEPQVGIQFRALLKTDRLYALDNSPIYEAVDISVPFDWIPGPEDEEGKEIRAQAHPLTGEEMMSFAELYIDYISNHEVFKDNLENMVIEVCPYKVYPASKTDAMVLTTGDEKKDANASKNPLYQLSHAKSFVDMDNSDSGLIIGRNAAVKGIIQIGADKLAKVDGKPVEIPQFWVQKLHANNTRGNVHAFVRTSDGAKVEPHEKLKIIRDLNAAPQNNNQSAPAQQESKPAQESYVSNEPAQNSSEVPTESAGFDDGLFDPEFDVFGQEADDNTSTTEVQVESAPEPKKLKFGAKK